MELKELYEMVEAVSKECNAVAHGVVIKIECVRGDTFNFVVWTTRRNRGLISMQLAAECTSQVRLAAHVNGFIENNIGD